MKGGDGSGRREGVWSLKSWLRSCLCGEGTWRGADERNTDPQYRDRGDHDLRYAAWSLITAYVGIMEPVLDEMRNQPLSEGR